MRIVSTLLILLALATSRHEAHESSATKLTMTTKFLYLRDLRDLRGYSFVDFVAQSEKTPMRDSAQALLQLARVQSGGGNSTAALETLRRARELAPNAEEVLSAFAQVSLAVQAPIAALTALEPLSRMYPAVAEYHYLGGVAFLQGGALPEATDALRDAHRLDPDRVLTLVALGLTLNGRKLYAEARPLLLRSLELEPENVDALAALAEAEEGAGDLEKADAYARRALARQDAHATANLVAGLVLMRQERYAEARDAFLKAAAAEPALAKAHYQVSLAYARLGDHANAEKHVELYRLKLRESEEQLKKLRMQR